MYAQARHQRRLGFSLQRFGSDTWIACWLIGTSCRCRGVAQGGRSPSGAALLDTQLCLYHSLRQMVKRGLLRRPRPQARMRPPAIVEIQIPSKRRARIAHAVVGPQIHLLVLHRTPQPLDEHAVPPGAPPVQADRDTLRLQQPREGRAGELAALVGIENLRPIPTPKSPDSRKGFPDAAAM